MTDNSNMLARFWGVRGSVPSPLRGDQVRGKVIAALREARQHSSFPTMSVEEIHDFADQLPFPSRSTHGGNTTCVEVRCDDALFILDMGTGLRELGNALMSDVFKTKKLHGHILQSHVHWDHIQGAPFWPQLYLPRRLFDTHFTFFGGKSWDAQLELVLAGQMNPPVFPVSFAELRQTAMRMEFQTVYDGWSVELPGESGTIRIFARKLNHPQETFGYRIEYAGCALAFTTDHEPYASGIPRGLSDLVRDANVWITDCQYAHETYTGNRGGVQRMGWGHSYPEYITAVARAAKPGQIITTHHDPDADDVTVMGLAQQVQSACGIPTMAAYEGFAWEADHEQHA